MLRRFGQGNSRFFIVAIGRTDVNIDGDTGGRVTHLGRTWPIEKSAAQLLQPEEAAAGRRISPAEAVLVIGGLSAVLWFGIARLVEFLF